MKKILLILIFTLVLNCKDRNSSEPYITGDTFRKHANFIFDETQTFDPELINKGDIVFVSTEPLDNLAKFFSDYHPKIKHKYILITHNGDLNIDDKFKSYFEDDKIYIWFAQNVNTKHHKLISIPIGFENRHWGRNYIECINEINHLKFSDNKKYLLSANFNILTNPIIRQPVYDLFVNNDICYLPRSKSVYEYLVDVAQSKFILSPHGNGLDCHRTWEALCLGVFPIVKTSFLDVLYESLPVLIVNEWSDVNVELLEKQYSYLIHNNYNKEKLYFNYWLNLIEYYQKMCLNS